MLIRCSSVYGGFQIAETSPEVLTSTNATVRGNALYNRNRVMIPASAFLREHGSLSFPDAVITSMHNPHQPKRVIDEQLYWIGQFHSHFGHYIVSLLPRLWAKSDYPCRIGYTGNISAEDIFSIPFAGRTLSSLGLGVEDFVHLSDFDLLRQVVVPGSSFIENSIVYKEFSTLNKQIARRIVPSFDTRKHDKPIYFSKTRIKSGVSRIVNEHDIADTLERAGVQIVYPEDLSLAAQISLWNNGNIFVGYAGSALHVAAFATGKKIISLNHSKYAESNQILIGEACRHHTAYLYPYAGADILPPGNGFHREVRIHDPMAVAEGLLRAIDNMDRDPDGSSMHPRPVTDTVSRLLYINEPFGENVAHNKVARMSSSDPDWQIIDADADAHAVISGRLSETYQFHTLNQQSPWWDVDLGALHLINEIRIFNRHDVARWRASYLQILFSNDRIEWELVDQRSDPVDFDGFDTDPYRWQPSGPLLTRYVRIQLPTHDMLHLNQVEVFGYRTDAVAI